MSTCALDHDRKGVTINIPWQALSPEALAGVIDEYISREGTDYGQRDYSLAQKRDQVMAQLRQGLVVINFDPDTGSTNLTPAAGSD